MGGFENISEYLNEKCPLAAGLFVELMGAVIEWNESP